MKAKAVMLTRKSTSRRTWELFADIKRLYGTFSEEAKRLKFPQNVKGLKKNQAMEIYHQLYFNQYKNRRLSQ